MHLHEAKMDVYMLYGGSKHIRTLSTCKLWLSFALTNWGNLDQTYVVNWIHSVEMITETTPWEHKNLENSKRPVRALLKHHF